MVKFGTPPEICTCTSTGFASSPRKATVSICATMGVPRLIVIPNTSSERLRLKSCMISLFQSRTKKEHMRESVSSAMEIVGFLSQI